MKLVLSATLFAVAFATGAFGQRVVVCQDGVLATVADAVLVQMDGALAKKPQPMVLIFSRQKLATSTGLDGRGGYKGYFFEDKSSLRIDGVPSTLSDLRKFRDGSTVKIHMLVPNGQCSGWQGVATFTSIEVTTKPKTSAKK